MSALRPSEHPATSPVKEVLILHAFDLHYNSRESSQTDADPPAPLTRPPEPQFPRVSHGAQRIRKDICQAHSMGFSSQQYCSSALLKVTCHVCVETGEVTGHTGEGVLVQDLTLPARTTPLSHAQLPRLSVQHQKPPPDHSPRGPGIFIPGWGGAWGYHWETKGPFVPGPPSPPHHPTLVTDRLELGT